MGAERQGREAERQRGREANVIRKLEEKCHEAPSRTPRPVPAPGHAHPTPTCVNGQSGRDVGA